MTERLYKSSEWEDARNDYKKNNPSPGDYWWGDNFIPILVVLAVSDNFATVCRKHKSVGSQRWTWDLTQTEILSRADFIEALKYGHVGTSHFWAVEEFKKGG